jgi:flagellar hook assembly protein FlgD
VSNGVSISGIFTYPNPAGAGYPAKPGCLTTFALQFTRPPKAISLNVYTMSGEHVKTIISNNILPPNRNRNPDGDNKWVYESDWDGRNDSGDSVAPGVYLYKVTADGINKTGRLAIVR